ncbi:hypothetical protein ACH5RR_010983 [Cinchona calisaya]|uniref:Uncharacterized protein n=1 Tax=Cinchona calisaya TaxID=153742 RepID=A0ABD3A679_9GENT
MGENAREKSAATEACINAGYSRKDDKRFWRELMAGRKRVHACSNDDVYKTQELKRRTWMTDHAPPPIWMINCALKVRKWRKPTCDKTAFNFF